MGSRQSRRLFSLSFVLASLLVVLFTPQIALVAAAGSSCELMPYEVLCGPEFPRFSQTPPEIAMPTDTVLDEARSLIKSGRFVEALDVLSAAGYSEGKNPRADYYRVLALCSMRKLEEALAVEPLVAQDGLYSGLVHYALGCVYLNQSGLFDSSDPATALSHLEASRRLLQDAGGLAFYTGLAYYELGRYDEAVAMLNKAVEQDELLAEAHLNLGFALARLGETQAAFNALHTAARLGADAQQVFMAIGDLHLETGSYAAAAESYRAVSDRVLAGTYKLSLSLLLAGNAEESEAVAQGIVEKYPKHFDAWMVLGRAKLALGKAEEAVKAFQSALWLRPGHFNARLCLASAYLSMFELDRAEYYVKSALEIYDGDAGAYKLLAEILERKGDTDGAREAARKSVQIDPSDPSARALYERLK